MFLVLKWKDYPGKVKYVADSDGRWVAATYDNLEGWALDENYWFINPPTDIYNLSTKFDSVEQAKTELEKLLISSGWKILSENDKRLVLL